MKILNALAAWVKTHAVLGEVHAERVKQDERFGEQNHPLGTGGEWFKAKATYARADAEYAESLGSLTWRHVLREEFYEMLAEADPAKVRAEALQVAAVAVAVVECIDRAQA